MGKTAEIWMVLGAGAALAVASLGSPARPPSVDESLRALVYGRADAAWTARATALAATDGSAAERIGRVAESARVDGVARGRALEALAQAGTPAAQAALRHALSAPTVRQDATYPMLVATLGRLTLPSMGTLAFLAAMREEAAMRGEPELLAASTHALDGAYARRLASVSKRRLHQARSTATHQR